MRTREDEVLIIIISTAAVIAVIIAGLWAYGKFINERGDGDVIQEITNDESLCNIAIIPINGDILPYAGANEDGSGSLPPSSNPDDVMAAFRAIEADSDIRGILMRIDSGGGSPIAGEIISNGLKNISLPSVSLIQGTGASSAYLIATGADTIIASPFSDIGSIGITMSYVDNVERNNQEGLQYISLTSAKFKDYGAPDKILTASERALFERDLKIYHEQFVKEVAENRGLPIEQVAKLADGSSMPGALALQNKLIDQLGDQETARAWFSGQLKLPPEEVVFCE